jgi:hypothetical protein
MTNALTQQFEGMYAAQTAILGVAIRATITGYGTNVRAVLNNVDTESFVMDGGVALRGGFSMLVKSSDLSGEPPKQTAVTANGPAAGLTLEISEVKNNYGTYDITVADFANMQP